MGSISLEREEVVTLSPSGLALLGEPPQKDVIKTRTESNTELLHLLLTLDK